MPIPFQKSPEGIPSVRAESCGKCHSEIYNEWRKSMHSNAFTDPLFQAYWRKSRFDRSCLNCHTPLENQLKNKIVRFKGDNYSKPIFKKNDRFDSKLQREGVTCAACHLNNGVIQGPYREDEIDAPHPVSLNKKLSSPELCIKCHQIKAKDYSFLKHDISSTVKEWEGSPYKRRGVICQTCHMPEIYRPIVKGGRKRQGRSHLWDGGNIPRQVKKGFTVTATGKEENNRLRIDITNSGAGHFIPTGDPKRRVIFIIKLINGKGKIIKKKKITFGRNILWWPFIIEFADTRLGPEKTRSVYITIPSSKHMKKAVIKIEGIFMLISPGQRAGLVKKYGLPGHIPGAYRFYDEIIPLSAVVKEKF